MQYWLMKSEPSEFGIDDLMKSPEQTAPWVGVRNYQARNFLRDDCAVGDTVFFYHSSCPEPGIAGLMEIVSDAYPDLTQFDETSPYYDPKSTREKPRWVSLDVKFLKKTSLVGLAELRATPGLAEMRLLARGNRLSVMPVSPSEFRTIKSLLKK